MNSQSAARSDVTDRPDGSIGEEISQPSVSVESASKVAKLYRTKRLFFRFEIGTRKVTRTSPASAGDLQAAPAGKPAAGAAPMLVAAPKAQAMALGPNPIPPGQPQAAGTPGSSDSTRSIYTDVTVGVTDMPPPDPPGPPRY